jgi:hypothetical protein
MLSKRLWRGSATLRQAQEEIFNTDQGSQFTSTVFTDVLQRHEIKISMDGRGRWMDNVFIERLWRSLKHEDIYLKGYADGREARAGISSWIEFYNTQRASFIAGTPHTDGGFFTMVQGLWICGQRMRVAHKSTAKAEDTAHRCMIFKKLERSSHQLTNRLSWSHFRGPLQILY